MYDPINYQQLTWIIVSYERKINNAADVTTKVYDVFLTHDKP